MFTRHIIGFAAVSPCQAVFFGVVLLALRLAIVGYCLKLQKAMAAAEGTLGSQPPTNSALGPWLGEGSALWRLLVQPLLRRQLLRWLPPAGPVVLLLLLLASYTVGTAQGGWSAANGRGRCSPTAAAAAPPVHSAAPSAPVLEGLARIGAGFCRGVGGIKPQGLRGEVCSLDECAALCRTSTGADGSGCLGLAWAPWLARFRGSE
eukprot:SAG11_NODE_113_length_16061_cov_16.161143_9_plen_205_part_00